MKLVSITIFAAMLTAIACGAITDDATMIVGQFENFKNTYGKRYANSEEEAKRLGIFIRNMKKAEEQQKLNPKATFGVNAYSDLSAEEFKNYHNGESHFKAQAAAKKNYAEVKSSSAQSVDWRQRGAVTPIKNQGQCGSCWSFSSTGNIEGQWALAGNSLVSLSEQELVSCDPTNNGCNGGLMDKAFEWLVNNKGGAITSEAQYPYVSGDGIVPQCSMFGKSTAATIRGHVDIQHSESAMSSWTASNGPLSIAVDATSWQTYTGGILTNCQSTQVDHGVLIVGFNLEGAQPYWIIKNSWGVSWGEEGYIRVAYGSNQCLITTVPCSSQV